MMRSVVKTIQALPHRLNCASYTLSVRQRTFCYLGGVTLGAGGAVVTYNLFESYNLGERISQVINPNCKRFLDATENVLPTNMYKQLNYTFASLSTFTIYSSYSIFGAIGSYYSGKILYDIVRTDIREFKSAKYSCCAMVRRGMGRIFLIPGMAYITMTSIAFTIYSVSKIYSQLTKKVSTEEELKKDE